MKKFATVNITFGATSSLLPGGHSAALNGKPW